MGIYRDNVGTTEKKMETTISGLGFRVSTSLWFGDRGLHVEFVDKGWGWGSAVARRICGLGLVPRRWARVFITYFLRP